MNIPEENTVAFDKEWNSIHKALMRQLKRSQNQLERSREELKQCLRWEEMQHEAELLQSNYSLLKRGKPDVKVWDWKTEVEKTIALDPKLIPQEEIASRFKKSKKLRKGIPYMEARLKHLQEEIVKIQEWIVQLEQILDLDQLTVWRGSVPIARLFPLLQKKEPSPPKERKPYLEFISETGMQIWVGRTARDNETLTFSLGKGSDWWLHAAGVPGSHVVIRTNKGVEPDPKTLQQAIQLALKYSKAKNRGEGEVCITQCKYVSRFGRGHIGKVQISKHKTVYTKMKSL